MTRAAGAKENAGLVSEAAAAETRRLLKCYDLEFTILISRHEGKFVNLPKSCFILKSYSKYFWQICCKAWLCGCVLR